MSVDLTKVFAPLSTFLFGTVDDTFRIGDEVVFVEAVDDTRVRVYHGVYVARNSDTWATVEYSYTYAGRLFTDRTMVKVDNMREYNEWLSDDTAFHAVDNWI